MIFLPVFEQYTRIKSHLHSRAFNFYLNILINFIIKFFLKNNVELKHSNI